MADWLGTRLLDGAGYGVTLRRSCGGIGVVGQLVQRELPAVDVLVVESSRVDGDQSRIVTEIRQHNAETTGGYVGSDIESICREAAIEALREDLDAEAAEMHHFRAVIESVRPTITEEIRTYYEEIRTYYEEIADEFKGGTAEPGRQKGRLGFR